MKAAARLLLILALIAPTFASAQVQTAPPPTCKLSANALKVGPNSKVRLDWQSANVTSGYLDPVGQIPSNGYAYVVPGKNMTYAASFTGPGGTIVCRVGIAVSDVAPTTGAGTVNTNVPINTAVPNVSLPTVQTMTPTAAGQGSSGFTGGIVPAECRSSSTDPLNTVKNCDLCSLAQLGQNLANFLLGVTIPAAALLFAWAGILYFSSRGNSGQIEKAHKVFRSVVIGFVIAVSAWVLVITVMNMLIHGKDFSGWNWQTLNCTETRKARLHSVEIGQYLSSSLPALQSYKSGYALTSEQEYKYTTECAKGDSASCSMLQLVGQPTYGTAGTCAQGSVYEQDVSDASVGSCYNPITDTVSDPILRSSGRLSANYTSEQNVWLSACRQGDAASCQSFSASSGSGELGARIGAATQQYAGTDTSSGPDGGNKACAWAVNNILAESGIAPIDGDSVALMQQKLRDGRGEFVGTDRDLAQTREGDIVIWKTSTMSHVGICEDDGCTRVASNSSANARFTNITSASFNGKSTANIYHVNN